MTELGRLLVGAGVVLVILGLGLTVGLGRLPGDLVLRRGGFTLYLPLATCLLASILITLILSLWRR